MKERIAAYLEELKQRPARNAERMREVLNALPSAILQVDADSLVVIETNPVFGTMSGLSPEECFGRSLPELVEGDLPRLLSQFRFGDTCTGELAILRQGAEATPVQVVISRANLAGIDSLVVSMMDITKHKAEEERQVGLLQRYGERIKEITCLYSAASILSKSDNLMDHISPLVRMLYTSLADQRNSCIELNLGGMVFREGECVEDGNCVSQPISINGRERGYLRLCKPLTGHTIHEEESQLIKGMVRLISSKLTEQDAIHRLRSSENRFRDLVENRTLGIVLMSTDGFIQYANPATTPLIGGEEAVPGTMLRELLEGVQAEFDSYQLELDPEKPTRSCVVRLPRPGQRSRYLEVVISHQHDEYENVIGLIAVIHDISERQRAVNRLESRRKAEQVMASIMTRFLVKSNMDEVLRDALESLSHLLFATRSSVLELDEEGLRYKVRQAWPNLDAARQLQPIDVTLLSHPWLRIALSRGSVILNNLKQVPPQSDDLLTICDSRDTQSLLITAVESGARPTHLLLFENTTRDRGWSEDIQTTLQLFARTLSSTLDRERHIIELNRLSAVVAQTDESIVITDTDGEITYVNPSFERATGYTSAEVIGKTPSLLNSNRHDKDFFRSMWQTISAGKVWTGKLFNRRKDGGVIEEEVSISPVFDRQDQIVNYVAVMRDVSQMAKLETQLRQAQKMEAIGQLAAGIAHEINTPTQYIGDNTRFLKESFEDLSELLVEMRETVGKASQRPEACEPLKALHQKAEDLDLEFILEEIPRAINQSLEGIERVSTIVRAMKDFSHPGSQNMSYNDINMALDSTLTVARNEWKYVADVELELDPQLPQVFCLAAELNQAFLNIITNAAHAIEEKHKGGGKGIIRVKTRGEGDNVVVSISDTGSGIPDSVRDKIFDPFFTTKQVGKGTGQGLSIVHHIVCDKHGGKVELESVVGEGTTFHLWIPIGSESDNG